MAPTSPFPSPPTHSQRPPPSLHQLLSKACGLPQASRKGVDKQSIRFPQGFRLQNNRLFVPKLGWVRIRLHRPVEGKMKNLTVTKTKSGQYFASIQVEVEVKLPHFIEKGIIALDLGLKDLVTFSDGRKVENPRWFRNSLKKIRKLHKRLSRTQKGSANREKVRKQLAKAYEKLRTPTRRLLAQVVVSTGHTTPFDLHRRPPCGGDDTQQETVGKPKRFSLGRVHSKKTPKEKQREEPNPPKKTEPQLSQCKSNNLQNMKCEFFLSKPLDKRKYFGYRGP